jgi:hypothetical protein
MAIIPMVCWVVLVVVVGWLLGAMVALESRLLRHERLVLKSALRKRKLWVGVGAVRSGLDAVRGARAERPITSRAVRCLAWRGRPHARACNRLFEEIHRLNRPETRHKNIGLTQQEEETR